MFPCSKVWLIPFPPWRFRKRRDVFYNSDKRTFYEDIEDKTDQFGCQRQTVKQEENTTVLLIPIKTETIVVGEVSQESCIRSRVQEVQNADAEFRDKNLDLKYQNLQWVQEEYAPALVVQELLLENGSLLTQVLDLECTSRWNNNKEEEGDDKNGLDGDGDDDDVMLLEMTCTANALDPDGSVSTTRAVIKTDSGYIHRFASGTTLTEISTLMERLARQLG